MQSIRAAIYARVSSAAQRDAHTIENQLRVLPAFVAANGWDLVGTYIDDGRSAKTGKLEARDGFARLRRDALARKFDVVVVVDIDRLTRTDDMIERARILGPFQQAGIDIVTPTGRFDLRSLTGELYVTLQAQFAAEENRKRAERITAGKLRAIAEGRKPAGPTPYGYSYSRAEGKWSISEPAAAIVREIYERVLAGESCATIAEDLYVRDVVSPRGPWERHKVWFIATSRTYVGTWTADKRRKLTMPVPPIIDDRSWHAAQAKLIEAGKRGLIKTKHIYLLEGLATCAVCGSPIHIRSACGPRDKKNKPAYVCRARKVARIGEARCSSPIFTVEDVDGRVWERIAEALVDPKLAAALNRRAAELAGDLRSWEEDVADWKRKLAKLEKHEAAVLTRFRRDHISEAAFDNELEAINRERTALRAQLETAQRAAVEGEAEPLLTAGAWLAKLQSWGAHATPEERQRVVRALVSKAVLDDGRVRLTLRVDLRGPSPRPQLHPRLSAVGDV